MKHPAWNIEIGMTHILLLGLGLFLGWAALFEIEQSVRAQGQLVPGTRTQVIQAADGGVLEKILVSEGQSVKAGQVLATLEPERATAGVDEGRARVAALSAALARARAEASGRTPVFGREFLAHPDVVADQLALYAQRRQGLAAELDTWTEALRLAQDELRINESLFDTGDTSRLELMRARRQVTEIEGRIQSVRNKYLLDARQEAAKLQEELSSQRFKLEERQSVLQHTELGSPVDGVVKVLRINTVGGVLRAGDELMQISPTDVDLLVELRISPADVGQLSPGLPVSVKIDAFDYSIYGSLTGTLEYISADTLTEQTGAAPAQTFYRARVRLERVQGNAKLPLEALKPGMTAAVDIRTGTRSVLTYLIKPITKALVGAGSER